jgi:hypothetical protein
MNTTAIAKHLNIVESAIVRCEEWVNVLFVVAKGIGARFVSKKVVKEEKMDNYTYTEENVRDIAAVRGADWDDECNQLLWDIVHAPKNEYICLHSQNNNPWELRANAIVAKFDGNGRTRRAIEKMATVLGRNIEE